VYVLLANEKVVPLLLTRSTFQSFLYQNSNITLPKDPKVLDESRCKDLSEDNIEYLTKLFLNGIDGEFLLRTLTKN